MKKMFEMFCSDVRFTKYSFQYQEALQNLIDLWLVLCSLYGCEWCPYNCHEWCCNLEHHLHISI